MNLFAPKQWGVVGVKVANPGDRPVEVLSSHHFGSRVDFQFARQFWIPPHAVRTSWYPVLPPENPNRAQSLPVKSLLIDRTRGGETLIGEAGGTLIRETLLPMQADSGPVTGLIADPSDPDAALLPRVARSAGNFSHRIASIDPNALPPTAAALQALDQLVVGSDRLAGSPTGALAIRQWLHAGGRLWVRLDRVSPETVALLLGHDFRVTVVDRVGLTQWRIDRERAITDPDDEAYDSADTLAPGQPGTPSQGAIGTFEASVEMVRVVVPGVKPVHTVDGWPASFWVRSGRGLVLFTALASRGWVTATDSQPSAGRFKESDALRQLATPFLKVRAAPPLYGVSLDPLLVSQVGYRVVGRGFVFVVLGAFCLSLLAGAWWLNRRGALVKLGWAGPVAALLASVLLVAAGSRANRRVPASIASVQFVEVVSGDDDATVTGRLALYSPDGAPASLGSEKGGVFIPDASAAATRRMVHTDLDRWKWENLSLPPGLHTTAFETTTRLTEPVSARVTFGPDGAIGTLAPGQFQHLEDAILAMPSRCNVALKPGASSAFRVGDRLPTGRYLASGVLTGDQQHRRSIYQQLLEQRTWPRYPLRPTVLAWASPLDLGFTFVERARRSGSALVAIPLELERPPAGTRVMIPAPFLPYRNVTGPNLVVLYNSRQNEWTARTSPGRALFRFQVPPELLPLRVDQATLEIDMNARGRTLEVFAGTGSELLATRAGPTGVVRIEFNHSDLLQPDSTGGIRLGLAVGAGPDEWKVSDLRLELTGQIPQE